MKAMSEATITLVSAVRTCQQCVQMLESMAISHAFQTPGQFNSASMSTCVTVIHLTIKNVTILITLVSNSAYINWCMG